MSVFIVGELSRNRIDIKLFRRRRREWHRFLRRSREGSRRSWKQRERKNRQNMQRGWQWMRKKSNDRAYHTFLLSFASIRDKNEEVTESGFGQIFHHELPHFFPFLQRLFLGFLFLFLFCCVQVYVLIAQVWELILNQRTLHMR